MRHAHRGQPYEILSWQFRIYMYTPHTCRIHNVYSVGGMNSRAAHAIVYIQFKLSMHAFP